MDSQILHEANKLVCSHLSLSPDVLKPLSDTYEDLHKALVPIISELLNSDMERLLNAFYRIDIDENKFKQVLAQEEPQNVAKKLATLVIEREILKAKTRLHYKKGD